MPKKKTADDSKDKYDNAAKIVFQERPMDVIQFATGYTSPTIEPLKTSLEIRKRREVDTLAKIKIPSEKNPRRLDAGWQETFLPFCFVIFASLQKKGEVKFEAKILHNVSYSVCQCFATSRHFV